MFTQTIMRFNRAISGIAFYAAAALVLVLPATSDAAWLGFKNETNGPVVVQGSSTVNNVPRKGKPYILFPGEIAWDFVSIPGTKTLTIYDAKQPIQVLYQDTVVVASADLFFSIQSEPPPATPSPPTKGQKPAGPKVKLLPTLPPSPPPKAPPAQPGPPAPPAPPQPKK